MSIHLRYELGFASEVRLWNDARIPMARDPGKPLTSRIFSFSVQAPWADPKL